MKQTFLARAAELLRASMRRKRWYRVCTGLAAAVVFVTTYMLILPAITLTSDQGAGAVPLGVNLDMAPEYTAELTLADGSVVTIGVYDPDGNVPEGAVLSAELYEEDSEDYAKAEADLLASGTVDSYDGMLAMDIHFEDADGVEVEPDGQVYVDLRALLPENVDPDSVAVQHHMTKESDGLFGWVSGEITELEVVADNSEETGDIEVELPEDGEQPEGEIPAEGEQPVEGEETEDGEQPAEGETPAEPETPAEGGEVDLPEEDTPATDTPETTDPEVTAPETTTPEETTPESTPESAPETTTPEVTAPETSAPETTEPETTAPETSAPEASAPEAGAPETTTPAESTVVDAAPADSGANVVATFSVNSFSTFTMTWNVMEVQEPELVCGLEEHSHEESCCDAEGNLICGLEEHTHTEECYAVELPEEELPLGGIPEEILAGDPDYTVEIETEDGRTVTVNVYDPYVAVPEGAELKADLLAEDSEEYAEAQANLDASDAVDEYAGMAALDIRFEDADGSEVEPAGKVFVDIQAQALIPEDADPDSVAVQHHVETTEDHFFGLIETKEVAVQVVADSSAETGDVTLTPSEVVIADEPTALSAEPDETADLAAETEETAAPAAQDVEAQFAVESFSTFTITWNAGSGKVATLHYGYMQGNQFIEFLNQPAFNISFSNSESDRANVSMLAYGTNVYENGAMYAFDSARYASATGTEIALLSYNSNYGIGWAYTKASAPDAWVNTDNYNNSVNIYMIYSTNTPELASTVDTSEFVTINLFDYDPQNSETGHNVNYNRYFNFFANNYNIQYNDYYNDDNPFNQYTESTAVYRGIVANELQNGYPVLNSSVTKYDDSLEYLFDGTMPEGEDVNGVAAYLNLNNLFQKDGTKYWFDSSQNFAQLVPDEDGYTFQVYEAANNFSDGSDAYFLPFNAYGSGKAEANYSFGMNISTTFMIPAGKQIDGQNMIFTFSGDDDVWVFIDDVLVLDIGGIHGSATGSINFTTGVVTQPDAKNADVVAGTDLSAIFEAAGKKWDGSEYSQHTLKFYYLERGGTASNCKIEFNLYLLKDNALYVGKELDSYSTTSADVEQYLNNLEYTFRVLNGSASATTTSENDLFVKPGTEYQIYAAEGEGTPEPTGRTGTVKDDGTFTIKANEFAVFNFKENAGKYYVQEIVKKEYSAQFGDVEVSVEGSGGESYNYQYNGVKINGQSFADMVSGTLDASDGTGVVNFTNKVNFDEISFLKIKKDAVDGSYFGQDDSFVINVTMADEAVPVGTAYQLYTEGEADATNLYVESPGQITLKPGQTAVFPVLTGTEYTVSEVNGNTYHVGYTATQTIGERTWTSENDGGYTLTLTTPDSGDTVASGVVGQAIDNITDTTNATVEVTITNRSYDFNTSVDISKTLTGYTSGEYSFTFDVVQVQSADNHNEMTSNKVGTPVGATITVDSTDAETGTVYFGFKNDVPADTYYYKVSEQKGSDATISYDESYYIVTVDVSEDGTSKSATVIDVTKYSGGERDDSFNWSTASEKELSFTNSLTGSLSITKTVEYNGDPNYNSTAVFAFDVTVAGAFGDGYTVAYTKGNETLAWETVKDYTGWPEGGTTTDFPTVNFDSNGEAIVYIPAGATIKISGLPAAVQASITETTTAGYSTKWTGNTATGNESVGADVTTAQISTNPVVTCTNTTGAVLPSTGGMGTTPFVTLGSLFTIGAGLLLLAQRRGKGGSAAA